MSGGDLAWREMPCDSAIAGAHVCVTSASAGELSVLISLADVGLIIHMAMFCIVATGVTVLGRTHTWVAMRCAAQIFTHRLPVAHFCSLFRCCLSAAGGRRRLTAVWDGTACESGVSPAPLGHSAPRRPVCPPSCASHVVDVHSADFPAACSAAPSREGSRPSRSALPLVDAHMMDRTVGQALCLQSDAFPDRAASCVYAWLPHMYMYMAMRTHSVGFTKFNRRCIAAAARRGSELQAPTCRLHT